MTAKHTAGPWKRIRIQSELRIVAPPNGRGRIIAEMGSSWGHDNATANAERIVACVNACEGLEDPSVVPEIVKFLRLLPWENLSGFREDQLARMGAIMRKIGGHQEKEGKK